ncbi:MAG: hypothetical protein LBU32_26835 [Clostridiales bacterium]|jgi:hypothetical protein|nr:hypothetical protein [Clostridiales bacterium]
MARMRENAGELPNVRVYTLNLPKGGFPHLAGCSRISKTGCYEPPNAAAGGKAARLDTGLEEAPKSIL